MGKRKKNMEHHDFYCLKCGKLGIPIMRQRGHEHGKYHRKKLYCIFCKEEVNHMECRTDEEVREFKDAFERGEFIDEAEESVSYVRSAGEWKKHLGT